MAKKLSDDEFMSAAYGTKMIKQADGVTPGNFDGFVIAEDDSVVTEVLSGSKNLTTELGLGAGRTFKQGNPIRSGKIITSITVGTGTVNAINAKP